MKKRKSKSKKPWSGWVVLDQYGDDMGTFQGRSAARRVLGMFNGMRIIRVREVPTTKKARGKG